MMRAAPARCRCVARRHPLRVHCDRGPVLSDIVREPGRLAPPGSAVAGGDRRRHATRYGVSLRSQTCVRPSSEMPLNPRTSSFEPASVTRILQP